MSYPSALKLSKRYDQAVKENGDKMCGDLPCKFKPIIGAPNTWHETMYIKPTNKTGDLNKLCIYRDKNDNYTQNPKLLVSGTENGGKREIKRIATLVGKKGFEKVAENLKGEPCLFEYDELSDNLKKELMGIRGKRQTYWTKETNDDTIKYYTDRDKYVDITKYLNLLQKVQLGHKKSDLVVKANYVDVSTNTLSADDKADGKINQHEWKTNVCLAKKDTDVFFAIKGEPCSNKKSYLGVLPTKIVSVDAMGNPKTYVDEVGATKQCVMYDANDATPEMTDSWAGTCKTPPSSWKKVGDTRNINSNPVKLDANGEPTCSNKLGNEIYVHNIPYVNRFTHPNGVRQLGDPMDDMNDIQPIPVYRGSCANNTNYFLANKNNKDPYVSNSLHKPVKKYANLF
jgi:hypothetical protein